MPEEITDVEKFLEIAKTRASECRIKKSGEHVKIKLRTPSKLYTLKTDSAHAEEILKQIEIEHIEM
ncbi:MAG: hypothetical protein ACTSWC_12400 [Promethearchaeota archaeon]